MCIQVILVAAGLLSVAATCSEHGTCSYSEETAVESVGTYTVSPFVVSSSAAIGDGMSSDAAPVYGSTATSLATSFQDDRTIAHLQTSLSQFPLSSPTLQSSTPEQGPSSPALQFSSPTDLVAPSSSFADRSSPTVQQTPSQTNPYSSSQLAEQKSTAVMWQQTSVLSLPPSLVTSSQSTMASSSTPDVQASPVTRETPTSVNVVVSTPQLIVPMASPTSALSMDNPSLQTSSKAKSSSLNYQVMSSTESTQTIRRTSVSSQASSWSLKTTPVLPQSSKTFNLLSTRSPLLPSRSPSVLPSPPLPPSRLVVLLLGSQVEIGTQQKPQAVANVTCQLSNMLGVSHVYITRVTLGGVAGRVRRQGLFSFNTVSFVITTTTDNSTIAKLNNRTLTIAGQRVNVTSVSISIAIPVSSSAEQGLAPGTVVGIVVGSVALILLLVLVVTAIGCYVWKEQTFRTYRIELAENAQNIEEDSKATELKKESSIDNNYYQLSIPTDRNSSERQSYTLQTTV